MAARFGNVLYWLGTIVAVIAISGAVIWNGWTFYEWRKARQEQDNFIAAYEELEAQKTCIPSPPPGFKIVTPLKDGERLCDPGESPIPKGDKQIIELKHARALIRTFRARLKHGSDVLDPAKSKQELSLFLGGILAAVGLVAYGLGWAARYVLRGPR